jgi:transcriptional regulator with XRE-family HTH domain
MTQEEVEHLASRIRQFRIERGMSIAQLAAATGISPSMLYTIERAETVPSLANLFLLGKALRTDRFYFLVRPSGDGEGERRPHHDVAEATRRANKPAVEAMKAACEGIAAGLVRRTRAEH